MKWIKKIKQVILKGKKFIRVTTKLPPEKTIDPAEDIPEFEIVDYRRRVPLEFFDMVEIDGELCEVLLETDVKIVEKEVKTCICGYENVSKGFSEVSQQWTYTTHCSGCRARFKPHRIKYKEMRKIRSDSNRPIE